MKPLYSPKELARIYNLIKISYSPSSYNFKDRLIENVSTGHKTELMPYVSYATEEYLCNKIESSWKTSLSTDTFGIAPVAHSKKLEEYIQLLCSEVPSPSIEPLSFFETFIKTDHLKFNSKILCKALGITPEEFVKNDVLTFLTIACYLCISTHSICADLKWTSTLMLDKFSYENLHNLQYLKDALAAKDAKGMYILNGVCNRFNIINVPIAYSINKEVGAIPFVDPDAGLVERCLSQFDPETHCELLKTLYSEAIAFGLEIAYLINTHTSTEVNSAIYSLLTIGASSDNDELTKLIYNTGVDTFVPAILLPADSEERFYTISEYIRSIEVQCTLDNICYNLAHGAYGNAYIHLPALFGAVISFAENYSLREFRVKQCAILYNYCKANGILKKEESTAEFYAGEDSELSGMLKEVLESAGVSEDSSKTKPKSKMLDLDEPDYKTSRKPSSHKDIYEDTSVSQALDGLIGNFKTDKYTYTIQDIYKYTDADKAKYEAIASHIKLVNTQLIKQIRDIKTYNSGGKYAGLRSGKLDRKALHKYKTDPNIFYQNIYKQKECDLAFGIVLDASGSMYGRGIEDGRTTMIVLHETLKALGINHSIIDHTCYNGKYYSDLRRYQCFKEDKGYTVRKNYALASITAESGNCDSGALWFMEKALLRTRNKDKICLIFSDGAPTECSGKDLVDQVRHMERNGIKVIGIGIGYPNISKYYSEYANGNNLKQMLDIVSNILKEYVLSKKE